MSEIDKSDLVEHTGGCHCGKVKFRVKAQATNLIVYDCNCSICVKKQNRHFIVPKANFTLEKESEQYLSVYKFNKMRAEHIFCRICGVQSFYKPRSNPDGFGVMPHCINSNTILSIDLKRFNGQDWEHSYEQDKIIKNLSKSK